MRSIKQGHQYFVKGTYALTQGYNLNNVVIKNNSISGSIRLPHGDTTERPAVPHNGDTRFNTFTGYLEYYDGLDWRSVTYQQDQPIIKDSFTGDGMTDQFGPLSFVPASEDNILVFVQNVFQIGGVNYSLVDSLGGFTPPLDYIKFGSTPPLNHSIIILHGFDRT